MHDSVHTSCMTCFAKHNYIAFFLFMIFLPIHMNKESMAITVRCKSSSAISAYTLPNLVALLFVFTTFPWNSVSFYAAAVDQGTYADHCASIVPESTAKPYNLPHHYFVKPQTGYYTGGGSGIPTPKSSGQVQNSIEFNPWSVRETDVQGLFKLGAHIQFLRARTYYFVGNSTIRRPRYRGGSHRRRTMLFFLNGFWSASSGNLCMVGSGFDSKRNKYLQNLKVVLKLHNLSNSTSVTSLISGTLESLSKNDPNHFEPVSILMPPSLNYQYTLVSNRSSNICSGTGSDDPPSSMKIERFCLVLSRRVLNREFDLKYSSHCVSAKNCTPFAAPNLPRVVSLKAIECLEDTQRLRVLVEFAESRRAGQQRHFDPNTTLVGEGSWDAKRNQLCVAACQFLDAADSWNDTHVGDCSTRLSLRFPATWTIGNTSSIAGQVWSTKTVTESGYFGKITFERPVNEFKSFQLAAQKYEYTKIEEVTKLCSGKKTGVGANDKNNIYPKPFSHDMRFDMSAKNSRGLVSWGSSVPISVGTRFYNQYWQSMKDASLVASTVSAPVSYSYNDRKPYNISYKIRIKLLSDAKLGNTSVSDEELQISAEGIYDETEGSLCMVGCRNLGSENLQPITNSVDCEIVVNFQFPPSDSSGYIKGSIESTRKKFDPLYFEHLELSSATGYVDEAERSIWRMDVEMSLALISTTLACIFVAFQLFHVKKHPDVLPSISLFMLLILTMGYMIPLMLNFEAMFSNNTNHRKALLGTGGWLEVNEVIVRAITMVSFLLKLRLLSLTWSARSANIELWVKEKKAFIVALPVYFAGALAVLLLMDWRKIGTEQEHPIFGALKSYAGLVMDGFLLPQILLNMFCKSKEKTLSLPFYIGTTFVRVLPHAYDLYRAHSLAVHQLNESYIYASHVADFYSTAWDVIITFGCLLFAGIIYLQQKFGGLCILPQKLIELGEYDKVPSVTEG